ncbi:MAG TPA: Maf family protein [Pyrinomonadaceae bacterium]|jgi:septum formation protein
MDKERERQAGSVELQAGDMMLERLVLASSSPRRSEILRAVGWPFEAEVRGIDESILPQEEATVYVERLARAKAEAVASQRLFGLVLGADTVVVVDGRVLGKPRGRDEAREMLRLLSGREHEVLTGVALVRAESKRFVVSHERTRVHFGAMSDAEIDWYVETGESMDRAGAYAVQGRAALFVESVEGDYFNVVGLPIRLVYRLAQEMATDEQKGEMAKG